jgi:hypothetical protein
MWPEQVPPSFYLMTETDPVSETLFLEHQTMDKVQKHIFPGIHVCFKAISANIIFCVVF